MYCSIRVLYFIIIYTYYYRVNAFFIFNLFYSLIFCMSYYYFLVLHAFASDMFVRDFYLNDNIL